MCCFEDCVTKENFTLWCKWSAGSKELLQDIYSTLLKFPSVRNQEWQNFISRTLRTVTFQNTVLYCQFKNLANPNHKSENTFWKLHFFPMSKSPSEMKVSQISQCNVEQNSSTCLTPKWFRLVQYSEFQFWIFLWKDWLLKV